jgi:hypothetical protein
MYLIPHLPSIDPIANPLASAKHAIAVVGYLSGDMSTPSGLNCD